MGVLISLSGVDNAGKSTQCKLLLEYSKCKKKKVAVTEFAFGYYLLKPFIGLLRKSTRSPNLGPVRRNNNLVFTLWFIPAFIDIWIGYLVHLRRLKMKHDIIICDRFYTDIWANLLYYGYIPELAFESLVKLLPKADKSIILQVEPDVGHKRINDEFPRSYYSEQTKIYENLSRIINCKVIRSNKSPNQIFKEIKSFLFPKKFSRHDP